jgi:hypothetical protein
VCAAISFREEEEFFRDIDLCVSTHRGATPALVWPAHGDRVLEALVVPPAALSLAEGAAFAGASVERREAGDETAALTSRLGSRLGADVIAFYLALGQGALTDDVSSDAETLLLTFSGGCACSVALRSEEDGGSTAGLHLRLRLGEALYIPARRAFRVAGVHASCLLLELRFPVPRQ